MKQCRRCLEYKTLDNYHKYNRMPDGLQTWCRQCVTEYKREWRTKSRSPEQQAINDLQAENRQLATRELKRCATCLVIKPMSEFWQGSTGTITGARGSCGDCQHTRNSKNRVLRIDTRSKQERNTVRNVNYAIQRGSIIRPSNCTVCGESPPKRRQTRIEFHHTDGYEPENAFVGIFVCSRCHRLIHLGRVEVTGECHFEPPRKNTR